MVASGPTLTLSLPMNFGTMPQLQWEIFVELKAGMWWAIPRWLCNMIVHEFKKGARTADYWWYWNDYTNGYWRNGSYRIFFDSVKQRNKESGYERNVKMVPVVEVGDEA